ncbi:MAG: response regulator [Deltaproteobacteria bacterium]|nr:response regulator [Deltaproteobacteria bacterium]
MKKSEKLFLIIDDEPDMCWALEHILETLGVNAKTAQSGEEALTLMRQNRFDLAFLDAKLPDSEGLELASRIRKISPDIKIVMVSGYFYKDDGLIEQALANGIISGFISKPFRQDEILKAIEGECSL